MRAALMLFWAVLGLLFVLVAAAALVIVVGDAVIDLWQRGNEVLAIIAGLGFPITFLVWPWTHTAFAIPLWIVFLAGVVSFSIANAWQRSGQPDW